MKRELQKLIPMSKVSYNLFLSREVNSSQHNYKKKTRYISEVVPQSLSEFLENNILYEDKNNNLSLHIFISYFIVINFSPFYHQYKQIGTNKKTTTSLNNLLLHQVSLSSTLASFTINTLYIPIKKATSHIQRLIFFFII